MVWPVQTQLWKRRGVGLRQDAVTDDEVGHGPTVLLCFRFFLSFFLCGFLSFALDAGPGPAGLDCTGTGYMTQNSQD